MMEVKKRERRESVSFSGNFDNTQWTFTCSNLTIEILEQCVKYVQT